MKEKYLIILPLSVLLAVNVLSAQAISNSIVQPSAVTDTLHANPKQFSAVPRRFDTNRDGLISREEWRLARPAWFGGNLATLNDFLARDHTSTKTLSPGEWQALYTSDRLYDIYDTNRDGIIDGVEALQIPLR